MPELQKMRSDGGVGDDGGSRGDAQGQGYRRGELKREILAQGWDREEGRLLVKEGCEY